MAIGSGLGLTFGGAAETTYGTYQAPARWWEVNTESLEKRKAILQGMGLRGGGLFPRASRRVVPTHDAGGSVALDVATKGMGLLFAQMLGSSATAVQQGGTTAYRQIHQPSANGLAGKSMTLQKGVPQTDGTSKPFTYKGCKVLSWTLACEVGGILTLTLEIDAREEETSTGLVAASYTTAEVLHFAQGTLKLGGTASTSSGLVSVAGGTTVAEVTAATVTGTNPMKTDRYFFGSAGLKGEPVHNDWLDYGGSLSAEFVNQATIRDLYAADTTTAMELIFEGSTISGAYKNTVALLAPAIKFDGETPKVGGPDVVGLTAPFKMLDDGTNAPVQLVYISTDTAV